MESLQDPKDGSKGSAEEILESVSESPEAHDDVSESHHSAGHESNDPLHVQKRLKQQKRAHDREIREMQTRIAELHSQLGSQQNTSSFEANPYAEPKSGGMDEAISKAVSFALQQKEMEERKAKAAEQAQHVSRQYQNFQQHLDNVSDKYDDFDEVVRGQHAPFTEHMRDTAALMLPKAGPGAAGEVLYHLGKHPEELSRISKLYPHEQASELVALSHALIKGGEHKKESPRPIGQVKANPITNSVGVTEKTSPSEIRAMMKAGKFR